MTDALRVALFVEGSAEMGVRQVATWLEQIWNEHLTTAAEVQRFETVTAISKRDLVAMDDAVPSPTGAEPLDMKLKRLGAGVAFDAAVVAWDLHPEWNDLGTFCRWDETVRLLVLLSQSEHLPTSWKDHAAIRAADYAAREVPSQRQSMPRLERGVILPLCMDPEFEALLTADERATRRALGFAKRPPNWPTAGWGPNGSRRPAEEVIRHAVECVPRTDPARRKIRGGWRRRKNEWGEYVLRRLLADPEARSVITSHPIVKRLAELRV